MIVAVSSSNHRSFHSWPQLGHFTTFCMEGTFHRYWWQERQRISVSFFKWSLRIVELRYREIITTGWFCRQIRQVVQCFTKGEWPFPW